MENTKIYISPDGTSFDYSIYFKHQIYDSVHKIESDIEDTNRYIEQAITKLKMLISMDPKLIIEEAKSKDQSVAQFINTEVDETVEWLQECYIKQNRLQILLDEYKYGNPDIIKETLEL